MSEPSSVKARRDRWLRIAVRLVPRHIRDEFRANLLADRKRSIAREGTTGPANWMSARELLNGVAQHFPLEPEAIGSRAPSAAVQRVGQTGFWLWRLAGPLLFLGYVLGSGPLLLGALTAILAAFASATVVILRGPDPLSPEQHRTVVGVLVGSAMLAGAAFVGAVPTLVLVGFSAAVDWPALASFAFSAFVFCMTGVVACFTATGWVASVWTQTRLIRVNVPPPASGRTVEPFELVEDELREREKTPEPQPAGVTVVPL
ncbi:MAG: hypothetical protein V3T86_17635 [Planctomycetota bacterium]